MQSKNTESAKKSFIVTFLLVVIFFLALCALCLANNYFYIYSPWSGFDFSFKSFAVFLIYLAPVTCILFALPCFVGLFFGYKAINSGRTEVVIYHTAIATVLSSFVINILICGGAVFAMLKDCHGEDCMAFIIVLMPVAAFFISILTGLIMGFLMQRLHDHNKIVSILKYFALGIIIIVVVVVVSGEASPYLFAKGIICSREDVDCRAEKALESGDYSICNKMMREKITECYAKIVVLKRDPSLCPQLYKKEDPEWLFWCYKSVGKEIHNASVCENVPESKYYSSNKWLCYQEVAVWWGEESICGSIKVDFYLRNCLREIGHQKCKSDFEYGYARDECFRTVDAQYPR